MRALRNVRMGAGCGGDVGGHILEMFTHGAKELHSVLPFVARRESRRTAVKKWRPIADCYKYAKRNLMKLTSSLHWSTGGWTFSNLYWGKGSYWTRNLFLMQPHLMKLDRAQRRTFRSVHGHMKHHWGLMQHLCNFDYSNLPENCMIFSVGFLRHFPLVSFRNAFRICSLVFFRFLQRRFSNKSLHCFPS